MDGTRKTLEVDDSLSIKDVMATVCVRMGIANHDEYGLIFESEDSTDLKSNTLKKGQTLSRGDEKIEKMKRKLHTDDELNWLDPSKTFREQGVQEKDILLLKRRLFYSDRNVDGRDPVQLNLLYIQLKEAILNGAHPVTIDQATTLAGLQCHVQYGNHDPQRHRPGFLELREFLPVEYMKTKGADKKILSQHKMCQNLTEVEAKLKYTQFCRSLDTYGINFFVVKEKQSSKNKLMPRLFGVSSHSVYRVDQKTKDILKSWPLTSIKRWAASVHGFSLDFGNYSDGVLSAKTSEGERITKLIADYIDLILKKRQYKDVVDFDGQEQTPIIESTVEQKMATSIGHVDLPDPAYSSRESSVMFSGYLADVAPRPYSQASILSDVGGFRVHELPSVQRALITSLQENQNIIQMAKRSLEEEEADDFVDALPAGRDAASVRFMQQRQELCRANISSNITSASAATVEILRTTTEDDQDTYMIIGSAVHTIGTNVENVLHDIRTVLHIQQQQEEQPLDKDRLLGAARDLATSFQDLLQAAQPIEPSHPERYSMEASRRKVLVDKIDDISRICDFLVTSMKEESDYDNLDQLQYKQSLLRMAEKVAHEAAQLIAKSKALTQRVEDPQDQEALIASATRAGLHTQRLVATAKIVAPVAHQPQCQNQLMEAAKCVTNSVQGLLDTATLVAPTSEADLLRTIGDQVRQVNQAVDSLEKHLASGPLSGLHDEAVSRIDEVTADLAGSPDSAEMARNARKCALVTAQLISQLKNQAESCADPEQQTQLLTAAKALADLTSRLVEAAKLCAANPDSQESQEQLKHAAAALRGLTNEIGSSVIKQRIIKTLHYTTQIAIIAATQLVNTAQNCAKKSRASNYQNTQDCKMVADLIPKLIMSVRGIRKDPDDQVAQVELLQSCSEFSEPCSDLASSSKLMQPTVTDPGLQRSLGSAVNQLENAVREMRQAMQSAAAVCKFLDLDCAIEQLRRLAVDVEETRESMRKDELRPLPGESLVDASIQLIQTAQAVSSQAAELAACAGNEEAAGKRAREVANHMLDIVQCSRCIMAFPLLSQEEAEQLSEATAAAVHSAAQLAEACKDPPSQHMQDMRTQLNNHLQEVLAFVPGTKQIDTVLAKINTRQHQLRAWPTDYLGLPQNTDYRRVQKDFSDSAIRLGDASNQVVSTCTTGNREEFAGSTVYFGELYDNFMDRGSNLIHATEADESRSTLAMGLDEVSQRSANMLSAARSAYQSPSVGHHRSSLQQAARLVSDSINNMIALCTTAAVAPEDTVCDAVLRKLMSAEIDRHHPSAQQGYFPLLSLMIQDTECIAEAMAEMPRCARDGNSTAVCNAVQQFGDCVYTLITERGAHCAYLIGVGEPSSVPGREPVIDPSFIQAQMADIQSACDAVVKSNAEQKPILRSAQIIAKRAESIVSHCKSARTRAPSDATGRKVVQSAKEVAQATSDLVKVIREMENDFKGTLPVFKKQAEHLMSCIESQSRLASTPECQGQSASISKDGLDAQEPLLTCILGLQEAACLLVKAARLLSRQDSASYETYSTASCAVSDAIKLLVGTVRDCAPAQPQLHEALELIRKCLRKLEEEELRPQQHGVADLESMTTSAHCLLDRLPRTRDAAKMSPETLSHCVSELSSYLYALSESGRGAEHENLLLQTRTVLEAFGNFFEGCQETGGNPEVTNTHEGLDESCDNCAEACHDLLASLEAISTQDGNLDSLRQAIQRDLDRVSKPLSELDADSSLKLVDFHTRLVRICSDLRRTFEDVCSISEVYDLPDLAAALAGQYSALVTESRGAMVTSGNKEMNKRMASALETLGKALLETVNVCEKLHFAGVNEGLSETLRQTVHDSLTDLLAPLQSSFRGTQACISAANTVSAIISDLDTTIMFASAGTLNALDNGGFTDHRESILKTARALVEDTRRLVSGAAGNQEELAASAQDAIMSVTRLTDSVKFGASALGHQQAEAQVSLINSVRDVTAALGELINCTKHAQEVSPINLKDSAKVLVNNVTSLLKTVKSVEDETCRGTRALESAIEAVKQELKSYDSPETPEDRRSVDTVEALRNPMITSTSLVMKAANSGKQQDVMEAANSSRRAVAELLQGVKAVCGGLARPGEGRLVERLDEPSCRLFMTARDLNLCFLSLLEQLLQQTDKPDKETLQRMARTSRQVTDAMLELNAAIQTLRAGPKLVLYFRPNAPKWWDYTEKRISAHAAYHRQKQCYYYYDSDMNRCSWNRPGQAACDEDDPLAAEREVDSAVIQIEEAAKRLADLKLHATAPGSKGQAPEGVIVDAAVAVSEAARELMRAASAAQREQPGDTHGFVAAARLVAAAVHHLCETGTAVTQRKAPEERLVSAAKQVAASTAQLLLAGRVRALVDSPAARRLQDAGLQVKRTAERLVAEAQAAVDRTEADQQFQLGDSMVSSVKMLITAREGIYKKERELEDMRKMYQGAWTEHQSRYPELYSEPPK